MSYLIGCAIALLMLIVAVGLIVFSINAFRNALEPSLSELFSGSGGSILSMGFYIGCASMGTGIFLTVFATKLIFA